MQKAYDELCLICRTVRETGWADKVRLDFSLINNMNYYNGIVFQGFVYGIPGSVLSGGRYDNLMARMHKKAGAVGFAVYLNMLERMDIPKE